MKVFLDPMHTIAEGFENGGFTLKLHLMFCVHTTYEEFKITTIASYFRYVFEEN